MQCIMKGRELLDKQWKGLGQSPENGIELLRALKKHPAYGKVPFVFYSRKITPEDVVEVLKAGATAAIRKRRWKNRREFLNLLRQARTLHQSKRAKRARRLGMNVNTSLFPA